jgi:hypothetical protein
VNPRWTVAAVVAGLALLTAVGPATAEVTDPPSATKVATVSDPRISESSGLAASPTHDDLVWTVNDSGHTASVFGVSTATGRTVAVLRLRGTDSRDWESMAAQRLPDGTGVLWIGDTGDNSGLRDSVVLRLVREPRTLPRHGAAIAVTPVSLRVRYPDGPHDVEALVVTADGRLLLVTKELFAATVYQVPAHAVATALSGRSVVDPVTARDVGGVAQSLVTDGSALPDGRVVLRGYVDAVVYADRTHTDRGLLAEHRIALPAQQQGETLTVVGGGTALLVGSEGVAQSLWRVPLGDPAVVRPSATATGQADAGSPTSGRGGSGGSGGSGGGTLPWALRIAALALLPAAFLLARRRRP